ncbi:MAG: DUF4091 domain-containing protein [Phycisphaerae bacterium]|nr:DUF4091 domain-containing protein [Phycisphaerae bacterium]
MRTQLVPLLLSASVLAAPAPAATPLFDFETDADVAALRLSSQGQSKLQRSPRFATSGASSLEFTTPAWKKGMPEWPSFEMKPTVSDWRPFDRLVVDVTNPRGERHTFQLLISDSKVPFRKGLRYRFDLPMRGCRRFVIPLSSLPRSVDRADIAILHFFTQRPDTDLELHLDNLVLLEKGETLPEPDMRCLRQAAELTLAGVREAEQTLKARQQEAEGLNDSPEAKEVVRGQFGVLMKRLAVLRKELGAESLTLARLDAVARQLTTVPSKADRVVSVLQLHRGCAALGRASGRMLVGFATSMVKVLPRDMPFDLQAARDVELNLARNEKESFQVAVLPVGDGLKQVSVSVGELKSDRGAVLAPDCIQCDVVGYVETKQRPPYSVSYVGWWPDPILDFLGPVDVAAGDLQTFWIRVRVPKAQAPGVYKGMLTVSAEGVAPQRFGLAVRVYGFTLPDHSPLPTAITFSERPAQMGGKDAWPKRKLQYADFLADYYIDYDSLYRKQAPDFDVVKRQHEQGQLVAFNLGNVFNAGAPTSGFDSAMNDTIARLRLAYDKAKNLGLLDHAYIYGFDERGKDQFPTLEKCAQGLQRAFPDVLLMTTSYDHSFGLDSVVKTIDAWCPLTPKFDVQQAAKARAAGRHVWWYICCGPHNPHANMFVEYAAIEGRLLMGAMTAKYRPDGFLYYSLTIWNDNKPIETGPFTTWNPVSWTTYHGDGSWFCSGKDGKPVPTIRLENFRDGLEDYAYALILEDIIRRQEAKSASLTEQEKQWLVQAKAALPVPEPLVKTTAEYSRDPARLYAWRNRVGDLIDRSGVKDANPWGADFGVRGLR